MTLRAAGQAWYQTVLAPRWRIVCLLPSAGLRLILGLLVANAIIGALPVAFILASSALVGKVPAAVASGAGSSAARPGGAGWSCRAPCASARSRRTDRTGRGSGGSRGGPEALPVPPRNGTGTGTCSGCRRARGCRGSAPRSRPRTKNRSGSARAQTLPDLHCHPASSGGSTG